MMIHRLVRQATAFNLGVALALGLAVASPGATATVDSDSDGVADTVDSCPETPFLELIDATGCSVCRCDASWSSHDAYVGCVVNEARRRHAAGTLAGRLVRSVVAHAKDSTCGDPTLIRCCVYREAVVGSPSRCRLLTPGQCSYSVQGKPSESAGPGSCSPTPCP